MHEKRNSKGKNIVTGGEKKKGGGDEKHLMRRREEPRKSFRLLQEGKVT